MSLKTPIRTLALLSAALCFGCKPSSHRDVVAVVPSPTGNIEAVLTEINGGATTSFGYEVDLRHSGAEKMVTVAALYGAVRNKQAYGVDLRWATDGILNIQYLRAKAIPYMVSSADVNGQRVQVVLDSGVTDTKAPPGSMLFNLERHAS